MPQQVTLPDGSIHEFPDGVTPEQMQTALASDIQASVNKPNVGYGETALRGVAQGATAGFADEIMGGIGTAWARTARPDLFKDQSIADTYREGRDMVRKGDAAAQEANPLTYLGGNIAGGIATAKMLPGIAPFKGAGLASRIGNAAAAGSAYGAVGGVGASNADVTKGDIAGTAEDAILGSVLGAGAGVIVQGAIEAPAAAKNLYAWVKQVAPSLSDAGAQKKMSDYVVRVMKDEGITPAELKAAAQEGKDVGINLSLPQSTQSPTLIADQKTIAGRGGLPGQAVRDFQQNQATQEVPTAIRDQLDTISPNRSPDVVGAQASADSGTAVKAAQKAQQDKAGPLYNSAFKANQNVASPEVDRVLSTPAGRQALKSAAVKMQNDMTLLGVPDADLAEQAKLAGTYEPGGIASGLKLRTLDYVKRALDDQIEVAQRTGERDNVRILTGLKSKLVSELDSADITARAGPNSFKPQGGDYAQARATYGGDAGDINNLKLDKVGQLSKLNVSNYETAAPKIFNDTPEGILRTRKTLEAVNPQGWKDITATYLEDSMKNKQALGKATTFRDLVLGDKENARRLEAAMPRGQLNGLKRFGEVLDKVLSTPDRNSDTAFKTIAGQRLDDATGLPIMQKGASPLNPANWPRKIVERWNETVRSRDFKALADILTNPDIDGLGRQLAGKAPNSAAAQRLVANWLDKVAGTAGIVATTNHREASGITP